MEDKSSKMVISAKELFITTPLLNANGYTYTLTSVISKMIDLAENDFGTRDQSYTLLGIEFVENETPKIWFPNNNERIVIQLQLQCLQEPDRACFQLAHEVIHLLSPIKGNEASVLEEGIATHFQVQFMQNHYASIGWLPTKIDWTEIGCQSYVKAMNAVKKLLTVDVDSIKKLRFHEPVISHITSKLIHELYPSFSKAVADNLETRFIRNNA